MTSEQAQDAEQPTFQITYAVTWLNKQGYDNETEVTVQAETHDEGKQLAVEVMHRVMGEVAYRTTLDSPKFFPGRPVRIE